MELIGHVMNYAWGKVGVRSAVAHLAALNNKDFCLDPKAPYSELWMGDHVNGPAKIKSTGDDISVVLPEPLSFLFKVLSIRQALSVQVHPNKEEAMQLHLRQPDIYKDPNHKPELAIALTPFLAMCGFRSHLQIYEICTRIRPIKAVIGEETLEKLKEETKESLQEVFKKWIYATEKQMLRCLYEINKEYRKELRIYGLLNIFKRLNRDFPNDIGVLGIFFLNVIRLAPGQSIYLGANEIHAYLEGDCIECMACSDNVIRAGLTPKFIDKKQLVQCLKYEGSPPEKKLFKPLYVDLYQTIYAPPVEDFAVVRLKLPVELGEYEWEFKPTDQILLVVHGAGKIKIPAQCREFTLRRGNIFYLPPDSGEKIIFEAIDCEDCEDDPSFALICEEEEDIGIEIEEVPGLEMNSQMPKKVEERKVKKISLVGEEMCGEGGEPCNVTEPEIELCSSGFKELDFEEGCYEEEGYEEQSSLNEKVPGKPQKRDFEVYIASANVYGTEWPYCESCVPEKDNTKRTCRQPNE